MKLLVAQWEELRLPAVPARKERTPSTTACMQMSSEVSQSRATPPSASLTEMTVSTFFMWKMQVGLDALPPGCTVVCRRRHAGMASLASIAAWEHFRNILEEGVDACAVVTFAQGFRG